MAPLDGEQMILEADNKMLTITTHRVRYSRSGGGAARVISMMLEAVTSCELTHTAYRALLLLAVLSLLAGFALNSPRDSTPLIVGAAVGATFVAAYFGTRRQVLRVASASSHIDVLLVGMKPERAVQIVDTVEWAKNARYLLRSTPSLVAPIAGSRPNASSEVYIDVRHHGA